MEKSKWATMLQQVQRNSSNINKNALFKNMLPHLKEQGERLLRNVFEVMKSIIIVILFDI